MLQVMDPSGPTTVDIIGVFLLAAVCGGAGATGGHLLARRILDATPGGSLWKTAAFGAGVGVSYPAAWIITVDSLRDLVGGLENVPLGGGFPAVVTAGVLALVLLLTSIVSQMIGGSPAGSHFRASLLTALTFAVVLSLGFYVLLPILFPVLFV